MNGNIILTFLYDLFQSIWKLLFNTYTPFAGLSIGVILLGVVVIGVLWSIVISMLQIGPSDFSNLGTPKDYFHKYKRKRQDYLKAENRFKSKHHGKLAEGEYFIKS